MVLSFQKRYSADKEILCLVEPEGELPCSQKPAIEPCPESAESSPNPDTLFLWGPFLPSVSRYPSRFWGFPVKILNSFLISTVCVVDLCLARIILLDLISLLNDLKLCSARFTTQTDR
jgi:hypothetical protein